MHHYRDRAKGSRPACNGGNQLPFARLQAYVSHGIMGLGVRDACGAVADFKQQLHALVQGKAKRETHTTNLDDQRYGIFPTCGRPNSPCFAKECRQSDDRQDSRTCQLDLTKPIAQRASNSCMAESKPHIWPRCGRHYPGDVRQDRYDR